MKKLPSHEELLKMFEYDEISGDLFKRPFVDAIGRSQTRHSKEPIRNILINHGGKRYYRTKITGDRSEFLVHRIIFKMVYGSDPESIDHIDGNGLNNSILNLRECSHVENHQNRRLSENNTSGHIGVSRSRDKKRWRARIRVNGKDVALGEFKDINDAIAVRKGAEITYGYHDGHGSIRPL